MKLKQKIFGSATFQGPNSRTYINQPFNMITLAPHIHVMWGRGEFMLEPVDEPMNPYRQNLRFKCVLPRRSSEKINLLTDPNSLDVVTEEEPIFNRTGARLGSGSIISFTTHDPENFPLPDRNLLSLQCLLIMVLRMAGRAGGDILETYDSDGGTIINSYPNYKPNEFISESVNSDRFRRVAPTTSVPLRKIFSSPFAKLLHFKDRMGEIKETKSALLKTRLS